MAFGKHFSIEEFKTLHTTKRLDVISNPKTGKLFLATESGKVVGAVSSKFRETEPAQIVELIDEATGEMLPVLCNQSQTNVVFSL